MQDATMTQNQAFQAISEKIEHIIQTDMVWDNEISLSGPAGTGKTYLTTKLVSQLQEKYHITITAPTHKALQVLRQNLLSENIDNVETKTLQSFLNIRLVTDFDQGTQRFEPIKTKEKDQSSTDILIVDESSMISQSLYDYIKTAIEANRVKVVLFVGDEYQLLPVDSHDNNIFNIGNAYKLEKIVRQAQGSYIINMATKARNIIMSQKYISIKEFFEDETFKNHVQIFSSEKEFFDDFCTPETWAKKDKVIASFTNNSVDAHNRVIRGRFWEAQDATNIPTLLKGDKVIFQQANIIDEKVVHQNSDIVELSHAEKKYENNLKIEYWDCRDLKNQPFKVIDPASQIKFKVALDKIAKMAREEKNYADRIELWKLFYNIKETFVDVKYTFASTIHKLQGSTYETVYIDLRDIENMKDKDMMYRLLYVAITRASDNVKVLLPMDFDDSLVTYQENILGAIDKKFAMLGIEL